MSDNVSTNRLNIDLYEGAVTIGLLNTADDVLGDYWVTYACGTPQMARDIAAGLIAKADELEAWA